MMTFQPPRRFSGNTQVQLDQVYTFLYQMTQQLNLAMVEAGNQQSEIAELKQKSDSTDTVDLEKAESNFKMVKALIIKSADIVNAYYEQINQKLSGQYVAQSDFATFQQKTEADITANSEAITIQFENVQSILTEQEDILQQLTDAQVASQSWIKQGLLDYDENEMPIYGVEVGQVVERDGQEVFNKFARFTAAGIYFYLPGTEEPVAQMTGQTLQITSAEIKNKLILNQYVLDLRNGIAFKWTGG